MSRPGALAIAVALVCLGCAEKRSTPDFRGGGGGRRHEAVRIDVENGNYQDVVVYLGRDGGWQRVGSVTGLTSATLDVPSGLHSATSRYQLRVHAIGTADSRDYVSGAIYADPGDVIRLLVASVLTMSTWSVRAGT